LRSSEELRRLVVDSATDAIIVTTEDGTITLWNPRAEAIFGWQSDEIVGRRVEETILPMAGDGPESRGLRRFVESSQGKLIGRRAELSGVAKDGRSIPIELTAVPYQAPDGHVFIGFIRDLTEQRMLGERLRQAQKMEAVGTLAAGIAHDFNNILAALSGNLMLARGDIPSDHVAQESLAEGEKAVARASDVVRQILTFSSARRSCAEAIDAEATLQEAIQLLRATIPTTMEIEANFGPSLSPILADTTDIHQIVLNLGINAHAALNGQTGTFEVQVTQVALDEETAKSLLNVAPGSYIRMSFSDTGCGMDERTLKRVFEPFFTTKLQGEGTGLGLSVVFGIVERHHGAISVNSQPGKGTVFHLYFPAVQVPAAVVEIATDAVPESGSGERILYVDDDDALVFMMTRMLRRLNYEVVGFQHSREALKAFRANPNGFDLVITDMSMPVLDGAALVRELRAVRPTIPIVIVTGYIRPKDLERATELGVQELLLKPSTVSEMAETLRRVLADVRTDAAVPLQLRSFGTA
jgi:PAS domain S-box-containing protein